MAGRRGQGARWDARLRDDRRGPGRRLRAALRLLGERRRTLRIGKVVWYTWLSEEGGANSFAWSGLRRLRDGRLRSAPALRVFRAAARG